MMSPTCKPPKWYKQSAGDKSLDVGGTVGIGEQLIGPRHSRRAETNGGERGCGECVGYCQLNCGRGGRTCSPLKSEWV